MHGPTQYQRTMDASPTHLAPVHCKDKEWTMHHLIVGQQSDMSANALANASVGLGSLPLPISD